MPKYAFADGSRNTNFYHYTDSRELIHFLAPDEIDRKKAHREALKSGAYAKLFSYWRQRPCISAHCSDEDMYDRVMYVAKDPVSSRAYGNILVTLHLKPGALILDKDTHWSQILNDQVMPELERRAPGLTVACENHENLAYIIADDTGIDLLDYHPVGEAHQWFQLVSPKSILSTEVKTEVKKDR